MFADTAAITAAGADLSRAGADFQAIAAGMPAAVQPCAAALGPVGADFLAALAVALAEAAGEATRLGADLSGAARLTGQTVAEYLGAERRGDRSIAAVGG